MNIGRFVHERTGWYLKIIHGKESANLTDPQAECIRTELESVFQVENRGASQPEIAITTNEGSFSFTVAKQRHRLLVRKQIEVHPRLTSFVKKVFELIGFHVMKDADLYIGAVGDCPVAVGMHFCDCNAESGDCNEITRRTLEL